MRVFLTLMTVLISLGSFAQDKKLLQKQLVQIMMDYPNKFKNIQKKDEPFVLKFQISGTWGNPLVMGSATEPYITAGLSTPGSAEEAKEIFDGWVEILDQMELNGAKLVGSECAPDKTAVHCKRWKFDNSGNNIAPGYLPFTIQVKIIKFRESYAGSLSIK